jgi:hypothetical protein
MKPFTVLRVAAMLTGAMAWTAEGAAQILSDPTRPSAGIYSTDTPAGSLRAGPLLQSVLITPSQRSAIIDGEFVKLGGEIGASRVIKITESEVVLSSGSGTETLHLYPDITVKPTVTASPPGTRPVKKRSRPASNTQGKQG